MKGKQRSGLELSWIIKKTTLCHCTIHKGALPHVDHATQKKKKRRKRKRLQSPPKELWYILSSYFFSTQGKKTYLNIVQCHNVFMLQLLRKSRAEKQDVWAWVLNRLHELASSLIFLSVSSLLKVETQTRSMSNPLKALRTVRGNNVSCSPWGFWFPCQEGSGTWTGSSY